MNCHEHNGAVAVASCSCGKALCVECQKKHQLPSCESCYVASRTGLRSKTIMRLWANSAFFLPYLDAFFQPFDSSSLHNLALLKALAWGFIGFR